MSTKWVESLEIDDRALYDKVLLYEQKRYEDLTPIGEVRENASQLFEQVRWINQMNNRCPNTTDDEIINWTIQYGPDLTSLPRLRSKFLSKKSSASAKEKKEKPKPSSWHNFQKKFFSEHLGVPFGERSSLCSKKWKEMTPEEKAAYE